MKKTLFRVLLLCFFGYLFLFPQKALQGAQNGLLLWFYTILPTLLPFFILSSLLFQRGERAERPRKLFSGSRLSARGWQVFVTGFFCGAPLGASLTADLYENRQLTRSQAGFLLAVTANPSLAFLLNYVMRQNPFPLPQQLLLFYLPYLLCTVFWYCRFLAGKRQELPADTAQEEAEKKEMSPPVSSGEMMDISIMNGFELITRLGGYIILCSIGLTVFELLPERWALLRLLLCCLLEMTTGIQQTALAGLLPKTCLLLTLCCASFGGLCIYLQIHSVLSKKQLPVSLCLKAKLLQTLLVAAAVLLFA